MNKPTRSRNHRSQALANAPRNALGSVATCTKERFCNPLVPGRAVVQADKMEIQG